MQMIMRIYTKNYNQGLEIISVISTESSDERSLKSVWSDSSDIFKNGSLNCSSQL